MMVVAIIDSHPVFLNGLSEILQHYFKNVQVIKSGNLNDFVEDKEHIDPDFIILGVNKVFDSTELKMFENIRQSQPTAATIIFFNELHMVFPFLTTGANGYLAKKSNPAELIDCMECLMAEKSYLDTQILDLIFGAPHI
jgi:DNA-binding NarL/FixJ family response regulator